MLCDVADVSEALDAWPRCRAQGCTSDHIMPPRKSSWEHFGGCKDGQQGVKPLEADLCLWAHNKFTPVQAQAKLCHNNMYAATYRSTMNTNEITTAKKCMPQLSTADRAQQKKTSAAHDFSQDLGRLQQTEMGSKVKVYDTAAIPSGGYAFVDCLLFACARIVGVCFHISTFCSKSTGDM